MLAHPDGHTGSKRSSLQSALGFPSRTDAGHCRPEAPTAPPVLSGEGEKELGKMKVGPCLNSELV